MPKRKLVPETKKLSGKKFQYWETFADKRNALKTRDRIKAKGHKARIITEKPVGRGATYHVYRRK